MTTRAVATGRLDHPRFDIEMVAESDIEVFRLGSCAKEPETIAWIEGYIRPGDVFYDVGANVGAYSLVADREMDGTGRVYAFEPGFSTFPTLVRNVFLNEFQDRVVPLSVALADASGLVPITYSTIEAGGAKHTFGQTSEDQPWQRVVSFALDEFRERFGLEQPNLIKIDVDGAEPLVLRGAPRTLRDPALRSVLVEVTEGEPETKEIVGLLEAAGLSLASRHFHERSGVSNFVFARG
jgi:FkbM family methyltransferase